ncbi:MAG: hypothetical protein FWC03_02560 [Treponema sp.]|nr:hypothetical protein [Treponema sp.]
MQKTETEKNIKEAPLHWSEHREEAAGYWQLKFLLILFWSLPVVVLGIIAFPVGFFYFLFSRRGRTESSRFLQKAALLVDDPKLEKKCRSRFGPLRHIISFSLSVLEKLQAWGGKFSFNDIYFQDDDIKELISGLEAGKGAILLFSHLGNAMLLQGLLNLGRTGVSRKIPVTAIMDMKVNPNFSRILNELNPRANMELIFPEDIGSQTAVLLEERIASGGLVLSAADRTSVDGRNIMIPFLGKEAPFSYGIFYLMSLLKAPVYFVFGLRRGDLSIKPKYNMHVHKSPLSFDCQRSERIKRTSLLAFSFVELLEKYSKAHPFQWYNFHDFWMERDNGA